MLFLLRLGWLAITVFHTEHGVVVVFDYILQDLSSDYT